MSGETGGRACGICGRAELPEDARFCPRCGGRLEIGAPAATSAADEVRERATDDYTPDHLRRHVLVTRSALEGERKRVAILLIDVVESLAMAEALDPEEIHTLMQGFFDVAIEAVHRHGGTINQFRGDGFMALFGAPRTRGGDALRAVRAALEIGSEGRSYSELVAQRYGVPLLLRTAVHVGLVWVGSIGSDRRRDYTAEGATVGLAARLEQMAEPGQILVSEQVAQQVAGHVRTRDLGARAVRGMRGAVRVHEVLAEEESGRAVAGDGTEDDPPLRGRARELRRIERQREALVEGSSCLVEVRGPSGVGKSRLLRALVERTRGASERGKPGGAPTWRVGTSREEDAARAFSAWLDLLERWPADDSQAGTATSLARDLRAGDAGRELAAVEARLRGLLEASFAEKSPALAFEDVQWMDPSSARVVAGLLERPPPSGLLVLVTCRDESPALWGAPSSLRVPLGPLAAEDVRALVGEILEEPPLVELVVERSGGNPLFALELARSLREGPDALRSAARAEAQVLQSTLRVPESIQGILAARLDSLPDEAKRLLQTASVIGAPFDVEFLRRLETEDAGNPTLLLNDLVSAGFLLRRGERLDFGHVLAREVAYEQMLLSRRRLLHGRLGELLEPEVEAGDPYVASVVGHHYGRAGQNASAARFLARAGKAYLQRLAVGEAASHLRRAWELLSAEQEVEPRLRVDVGLHLAEALNDRDLSGEASAILESLPSLAAEAGEDAAGRLSIAQALVNQGWVLFTEHEKIREGTELLERGLALAERCKESERVVGSACAFLIRVHHLEGRIDRAVASARRVAEIASAAGNRFALVFGRGNEGFVICDRGDVERGLRLCEEAVALSVEAEDRAAEALARAWLARAWVYAGDAERALAASEAALGVARVSGQAAALYTAHMAAGEAYLLRGEARRGAACFDELVKVNDRWTSTRVELALGRLELGRFDEAIALAEASLDREPPRLHRIRLLRILGVALGCAKQGDAAGAALRESLSLADELELRPHVAAALAGLAEVSACSGEEEAAAYYLERATGVWTACGMTTHAEAARTALMAS